MTRPWRLAGRVMVSTANSAAAGATAVWVVHAPSEAASDLEVMFAVFGLTSTLWAVAEAVGRGLERLGSRLGASRERDQDQLGSNLPLA